MSYNLENHSKKCPYKDTDALLYCLLEIIENKRILIAASEIEMFDTYLELAKDKDSGIEIDMDSCDTVPYQIVYGGLMYYDNDWNKVKKYAEYMKGYALIDLAQNPQKIIASTYDDIIFYPDNAKFDRFIPFAALIKTKCILEFEDTSVTLFPFQDKHTIWESMANRPFLLACRKFIPCSKNITVENWKDYINFDDMMNAYKVADLYTGKVD